jgi:hypothetical protein
MNIQFKTPIILAKSAIKISHKNQFLSIGSCFSTNMGEKLNNASFKTCINPFGVLYNPISIANVVNGVLNQKQYDIKDLYAHQNLWVSFDHHGQFSNENPSHVLDAINNHILEAKPFISNQSVLLITWGSAHIYTHLTDGKIVANCHKIPAKEFSKEMLSVDSIVMEYSKLLHQLKELYPNLNVILTISPVRYLSDGFFQNQLSKSILHLAAHQLQEQNSNLQYFPAYEIMMDDLRDYRFYDTDMLHPSKLALEYIWGQFSAQYFNAVTQQLISTIEELNQALQHRPFHTQSTAYKSFLNQQIEKIKGLQIQNTTLDLSLILTKFEEKRKEI